MKRTALFLLLTFACLAAETKLGKPFTLKTAVPAADVLAAPDKYVGKTVQVSGQITEVCKKAGCWMMLVDPATKKGVRIKVNDGEIVFPQTAVGKKAIAEGKLSQIVRTKEQAIEARKHEAEEQGKKFDPASVTSGETVYQVQGTGAVILD